MKLSQSFPSNFDQLSCFIVRLVKFDELDKLVVFSRKKKRKKEKGKGKKIKVGKFNLETVSNKFTPTEFGMFHQCSLLILLYSATSILILGAKEVVILVTLQVDENV